MSETDYLAAQKKLASKEDAAHAQRTAREVAHKFGIGQATGQDVLDALISIGVTAAKVAETPEQVHAIDITIIASLETCASRIETAKTPFLKSDREEIAVELRKVIEKLS